MRVETGGGWERLFSGGGGGGECTRVNVVVGVGMMVGEFEEGVD